MVLPADERQLQWHHLVNDIMMFHESRPTGSSIVMLARNTQETT